MLGLCGAIGIQLVILCSSIFLNELHQIFTQKVKPMYDRYKQHLPDSIGRPKAGPKQATEIIATYEEIR